MTLPVVVVGSQDDLHVAAVVADLAGIDPLLIDVARLADVEFGVSPNCVEITVDDRTFDLSRGWRGWIRRLSPADWEQGVIIGSHDASAMAAWLSLLAALLRHPEACWLSDLDCMNAAENKITQYIAAQRLGLAVPSTIVTNSVERAAACGTDLIAKPLGPGHYRTQDGEWRTVFTDAFDPRGPDGDSACWSAVYCAAEAACTGTQACRHRRGTSVGIQSGWRRSPCGLAAGGSRPPRSGARTRLTARR